MRFSYFLFILVLFLPIVLSNFCGDSSGGLLYNFSTLGTTKHFMGINSNSIDATLDETDYFSFPSTESSVNSVLECCGNDLYVQRYFSGNDVNERKQIFKIPFLSKNIYNISTYTVNEKNCSGNDFYFTRSHDNLLCKSVSASAENVFCAKPDDWNSFSLYMKCDVYGVKGCDQDPVFSNTCDSWSSIPKGRYSECGGDMYFFSQYGLMKSVQGESSFEKLSDSNFYYSKAFCNNIFGSNDFYIADKDNNLFKSIEGTYTFEKFNKYSLGGYFGGDDFYWQSLDGVYKSIGGQRAFYKISENTTAFSKRFSQLYLPCSPSCFSCTNPKFYVNPVSYEFFWAEDNGNIVKSSMLGDNESSLVMNISINGFSSTYVDVDFAKEYSFFWTYYRPEDSEDIQNVLVKTKGGQSGNYSTNSTSVRSSIHLNRITADYYYQNQDNNWMKIPGGSFNAVNLFSSFRNAPSLVYNKYSSNGLHKAFSNYDVHTNDISSFDYLLYFNPLSTGYVQHTRADSFAEQATIMNICSDSYFIDSYPAGNGDKASFKINYSGNLVELPLDTLYGNFCGPNYYWRLRNDSSSLLTTTILGSFEDQLNYHNFGNYSNGAYSYCALSKYFIFADVSNNLHLIDNPSKKEILCNNVSDLSKISVLKNGLVVCDSSSQNQIHSIKKFELDEPTLVSVYDKIYGFCGDEFFYSKKTGDLNYLYSYNPKTNASYSLGGIDVSQSIFCKWNTVKWSYLGKLNYWFLKNFFPIESNTNYITSSDGFVNNKENSNFIINSSYCRNETCYPDALNCSNWEGNNKPECFGTFENATKADGEMEITLNSKNNGLVEKNTRPVCGYNLDVACNDAYYDTKGICEFTCNYGYHKVGNSCLPNSYLVIEDCSQDGVCNPLCKFGEDLDCEKVCVEAGGSCCSGGDCCSGYTCSPTTNVCVGSLPVGSDCNSDSQCLSGVCDSDTDTCGELVCEFSNGLSRNGEAYSLDVDETILSKAFEVDWLKYFIVDSSETGSNSYACSLASLSLNPAHDGVATGGINYLCGGDLYWKKWFTDDVDSLPYLFTLMNKSTQGDFAPFSFDSSAGNNFIETPASCCGSDFYFAESITDNLFKSVSSQKSVSNIGSSLVSESRCCYSDYYWNDTDYDSGGDKNDVYKISEGALSGSKVGLGFTRDGVCCGCDFYWGEREPYPEVPSDLDGPLGWVLNKSKLDSSIGLNELIGPNQPVVIPYWWPVSNYNNLIGEGCESDSLRNLMCKNGNLYVRMDYNQPLGFDDMNDWYVCESGSDVCVPMAEPILVDDPKCTGVVPLNSSICSCDEFNLDNDLEIDLVSNCTPQSKCEFICNKGFVKQGDACVSLCGNNVCDSSIGETNWNCPQDCDAPCTIVGLPCTSDSNCCSNNCENNFCATDSGDQKNSISVLDASYKSNTLSLSLECLFDADSNLSVVDVNKDLVYFENTFCSSNLEEVSFILSLEGDKTYSIVSKINAPCQVCSREVFVYVPKEQKSSIPDGNIFSLILVAFIVVFVLIESKRKTNFL